MHHFVGIIHSGKIVLIIFISVIFLLCFSCNRHYKTPEKSIEYFKQHLIYIKNKTGLLHHEAALLL